MKIAILTQPLRYNYGGILQNYALQTILKRQGHEVYTIDMHIDKPTYRRMGFYIKWFFRKIFTNKQMPISKPVSRRKFLKETRCLQEFISKNISRTEYVANYKKLHKIVHHKFDCYITGSDQVWLKKFKTATFFGFLPENDPARRYAYAASFGDSSWRYSPELTEQCSRLAKKFTAISVRENSGVRLCKEHLGVDAVHVLDPAMLLTAEDYSALTSGVKPAAKGKFIMTYILDMSEERKKIVDSIARQLGLPVVSFVSPDNSLVPPIEEWLTGFRDASFVITDSFHGTALSIVHNKPFFSRLNTKRGADRFHSLLSLFALEDRLLYDNNSPEQIHPEGIDYDRVNRLLDEERKKSMTFIENIR